MAQHQNHRHSMARAGVEFGQITWLALEQKTTLQLVHHVLGVPATAVMVKMLVSFAIQVHYARCKPTKNTQAERGYIKNGKQLRCYNNKINQRYLSTTS